MTVCASDAGEHRWPRGVTQRLHDLTDRPWSLPEQTHAVIAQGHNGDPKSVAALLNHHAKHVYLIASEKRSQEVIQSARPLIKNQGLLDKQFSSPAGLSLGGQTSTEIALSVLAEIQWRYHGQEDCYPLTDAQHTQTYKLRSNLSSVTCPGKRP